MSSSPLVTDFRSVCVAGKTCSGKSGFAQALAERLGVNCISFGDFVRFKAKLQGLPDDVQTLQALGQKMVDENVSVFVHDVAEWALKDPVNLSHRLIIWDGIRHSNVYMEITKLSLTTTLIFVDVPEDQRMIRVRNKYDNDSALPMDKLVEDLRKCADKLVSGFADPVETAAEAAQSLSLEDSLV